MPGDEWRVEVALKDEEHGQSVGERMRSLLIDEEARGLLSDGIIVTRDDLDLFLYAGDEAGAREAERVIRDLLSGDQLEAEVSLTRWHPVQEDWVDGSVPLPDTDADRGAELERKERREAQEAVEEGDTDWDVRATFASHGRTEEVSDGLEAEGFDVLRRWRHLVAKVLTEEDARALEERLRSEGAEDVEIEARDVHMYGPFRFFAGIFG